MSVPSILLEPGRILLYRGRRLLVTRVDEPLAGTTSLATALDIDQRRYHLFLTPLGWAIDFRQERLTVASLTRLPHDMVAAILGFLPLRERLARRVLSQHVKRASSLDPGVRRLETLSPDQGLHQALANNSWEEIMLWHTRHPGIELTAAEEFSDIGRAYQLFCDYEQRARQGDPVYHVRWLLWYASRYYDLEVMRYLLGTGIYTLPALLTFLGGVVNEGLVDALHIILDYIGRKHPDDLPTAITASATEAGKLHQRSVMVGLTEWYGEAGAMLVFRAILQILERYLRCTVDCYIPDLDRLVSYWPPGFRVPNKERAEWHKILVQRNKPELVRWLDELASRL
jgi:hypothetical protein